MLLPEGTAVVLPRGKNIGSKDNAESVTANEGC